MERLGVNFARPTPNYLLLVCGAAVALGLLIGLAMALAARDWILTSILIASAFGLAVFIWLNLRRVKSLESAERVKNLDWEIALPGSQKYKLSGEVRELASLMNVSDERIGDLLSAYVVAEDLALRQIQQEAGQPLLRHVQIGATPFDAVLLKPELITCIEVVFLVTPQIDQKKVDYFLKKIVTVAENLRRRQVDSKVRLLLALVTQLDQTGEAELRSSLVGKFAATPVDIDIRLLDFEGLQKIYAID